METCYIVDTHAHLDMKPLSSDVDAVIRRASDDGVRQIITIGIDRLSSKRAVEIASEHPNVYASVGIHPHDAAKSDIDVIEFLQELASSHSDKVVAWGEVGLDYAKEYSPRHIQKDIFARQISAASALSLPLIIHAREANNDALDILASELEPGAKGVFHCFSGDIDVARRVLDMGFYISVTGVVTFKNAQGLRDVVAFCPSDRLLVETDAPFLSPVPFRGKPNEPARVSLVVKAVADIKEVSTREAACFTTQNAQDLFKLPAL